MIGARVQQYHGWASALFRLRPRAAKDANQPLRLTEAQDGFHELFRFDPTRGDDRAGLSFAGPLSRPVDDGLDILQRSRRWNGRGSPRAHLGQLRTRDRAAERFQLFRECVVAAGARFADDQNPPRGRSRDRLKIDLRDRVDGVAVELEALDRNAVGAEVLDGVGAAPRGDDLRQRPLLDQERLAAKHRRHEREAVNGVVRERRLQREGRSEPQPDQRDFADAGLFAQEFRRLANSTRSRLRSLRDRRRRQANRRGRDSRNAASASRRRRDDPRARANSGESRAPHNPKPRKARRRDRRRPPGAAIQNSLRTQRASCRSKCPPSKRDRASPNRDGSAVSDLGQRPRFSEP